MVTETVFADPPHTAVIFFVRTFGSSRTRNISQGENLNHFMATGPGRIGYDVFDKFIKLLLEEIMGAFFVPLIVISGAKLYFLGAVLPFALVYFRRCLYIHWDTLE